MHQKLLINQKIQCFSYHWVDYMVNRIINAVKTSGVLKERLFNAAYNSKRQAIMNGMVLTVINVYFCMPCFILCTSNSFNTFLKIYLWFQDFFLPLSFIFSSFSKSDFNAHNIISTIGLGKILFETIFYARWGTWNFDLLVEDTYFLLVKLCSY